jgi:phage baseplate assembly protein W
VDDRAFLGVGWAFPVALAAAGELSMAAYEQDIREAVHIILATEPGERVMRPDFGAGLDRLVFEPINTTTMSLVQHYAEEALVTWEPRIDSVAVAVSADAPRGRLMLDVRYRVRTTNTYYNLVYPFYLMEGRES